MATFYIEQFGCRATQADAAALESRLRQQGAIPAAESGAADFVIVNTCTVTAAADAQAREAVRTIHRKNPAAQILVTGCYAQRAPEELAEMPGVRWVVGNSHKPEIPVLVGNAPGFLPLEALAPRPAAEILTGDILDHAEMLTAPVLGGEAGHTRPVLKIQDGCDSRCSFCVIPFVRGRSRSLPEETVLGEIRALVAGGYREMVLSGIDLGSWGRDLTPRREFLPLLERILAETAVERLRISSIEPLDLTEDFISLVAATPRMARHFHVPLQSGSDRILAAMRRWYRTEHYEARVSRIERLLPGAGLGADVITGFPGETEEDHAATMELVRRLSFTYLHVFSYSARPGTDAAALAGQIPAAVIQRRARELRALAEEKSRAFLRAQTGRTMCVLTLNPSANTPPGCTPAISSHYARVQISGCFPANLWLDVQVSGAQENHLLAEPVAPLLAASEAHA